MSHSRSGEKIRFMTTHNLASSERPENWLKRDMNISNLMSNILIVFETNSAMAFSETSDFISFY